MKNRNYAETSAKLEAAWIEDEEYLRILQTMIIPCVDVVFHVKGDQAIYLAKRRVLPMASYWLLGGRMLFSDSTPEMAASRAVKRESGLDVAPSRFQLLCSHLYSWERVKQGNFTGRNIALIFSCEASREEIEEISRNLDGDEFDKEFGLQKFDAKRLKALDVHSAIKDIFNQMF
jgi:ADP-ribose pyrophosphatase YjhB (NUDIX family)